MIYQKILSIYLYLCHNAKKLRSLSICLSILLIPTLCLYFFPHLVGFVALFFLVFLLGIPLVAPKIIEHLILDEKYKKAREVSSYLKWLYPVKSYFVQHQLLLALELGAKGKIPEAFRLVEKYQNYPSSLLITVKALLFYFKADWPGYLFWLKDKIPERLISKNPTLLIIYLRSLGETGDLQTLLWEFHKYKKVLGKQNYYLLNVGRMFALAFAGETEQVLELFNTTLSICSENLRIFWLATSEIATGKLDLAREVLLQLRLQDDLVLSNAIDWRLCHAIDNSQFNSEPYFKQNIALILQEFERESTYQKSNHKQDKRAYFTYLIILINLLFFAIQNIQGGSQDLKTIYKLGGLAPNEVWQGQWWRLINANFLHFGWVHLITNMISLYFIGRLVEYHLGHIRYIFVYLLSGVGSMFIYSLISPPNTILVGASGAIMGLVGVTVSLMLVTWKRYSSFVAYQNLLLLFFLISLQFVFDFSNPQVSWLIHLLGLMLGFLFGIILIMF